MTAAVDAGVDRRTVAANFVPESAIWTPVQLRAEFGTVECAVARRCTPESVRNSPTP